MKLLGVTNGKIVLASISHYDYISVDRLMADGGQPGTSHYAGYNRFSGEVVWFEISESFSDLYNDYSYNSSQGKTRKYGKWNIEDVRILTEDEYPNTESLNYKVENSIWGTRGINGDQPLKYVNLVDCDTDHLEAILDDTRNISITEIITEILKQRYGTKALAS